MIQDKNEVIYEPGAWIAVRYCRVSKCVSTFHTIRGTQSHQTLSDWRKFHRTPYENIGQLPDKYPSWVHPQFSDPRTTMLIASSVFVSPYYLPTPSPPKFPQLKLPLDKDRPCSYADE